MDPVKFCTPESQRALDNLGDMMRLIRDLANGFSADGEFNCRTSEKSLAEIATEANRLSLLIYGCDECDGLGLIVCGGCPIPGHTIIERCDACEAFADDLEAAKSWGDGAVWYVGQGRTHAIAVERPESAE